MTTEERIANLGIRIETLEEAQAIVTHQLAQAHVDQWQARIDDLRLQVHLGAADASDRVTTLSAELEQRWNRVRQQVISVSTSTTDAAETILAGLESAYEEVRDALIESRKQFS